MDIFDLPQKEQMSKDEMEILQQKQHEYKYIGSQRRRPGMTLFCYNQKTNEIKVAPLQQSKDVSFTTKEAIHRPKIVIEPFCYYRWALNKKNFVKRLRKEGIYVPEGYGRRVLQ